MKIRPVGAELFHVDGRTDMTNLRVTFRYLANTPKSTRIVQAHSGSDSDSESRRQSAQRMSFV